MKIVTQTPDEIIYTFSTWVRAVKLGIFIVVLDFIMLIGFLKSGGHYSGLPAWESLVLLTFIILLLISSLLAFSSACWTTVAIHKSSGQILIKRSGLFGKKWVFNFSDVAQVEMHKIERNVRRQIVYPSHQLFLNLKDGTKVALDNEIADTATNIDQSTSFGTQIAQLLNVSLQETKPYKEYVESPIDGL